MPGVRVVILFLVRLPQSVGLSDACFLGGRRARLTGEPLLAGFSGGEIMSRSVFLGGLTGARVVTAVSLALVAGSDALAQTPAADDRAQVTEVVHEWVKSNPAGRTTAPERPVPKDNRHPKISPEEREKLGLPTPTWVAAHGKVQPAVREALEDQRKRIEAREPMIEFQGDRPIGFQGTAYVDVYLRHQAKGEHASRQNAAAVKEVQRRILSKLTAAEFRLIIAFQNTAGLMGYVNEAGLAKLVEDREVVAIGLDDQPRPEDPALAMEGPRPRGAHNERRGKVEVRVYAALEESPDGYALVAVNLEQTQRDEATPEAQRAAVLAVYQRLLSKLSADEFRLRGLGVTFPRMHGYVNGAGLAKLEAHPDVVGVGLRLNVPIRFPARYRYKGQEMPSNP